MAAVDINRGTTGVSLPRSVSTEIWSAAVEDSAVMQAARQITLPGVGISIPMVTGEATANWVAEADEKPVSRPAVSSKTMTAYTLAVIVPFSNQFRRDAGTLYTELIRRLPAALSKKFDSTVYGVGTAPGSDFDQLTSAPSLTVDGTGTFADAVAVVNAIAANGGDLSHWVVSPALYGLLLGSVNTLGQQYFVQGTTPGTQVGSVFGAPVIKTKGAMRTSTTVGDDTGIAGDWANSAVWGSVEGVQVAISDQATINDGGTAINLWQRNMFAVRAEIEVGFRVKDINNFVRITDGAVDNP